MTNTFDSVVKPLLGEDLLPAIHWLQKSRLLKTEAKCESCGTAMRWVKYMKSGDGYAWKCQNEICKRYKNTTSIRTDTFYAKSKISLQKWIHIMYLWSEETGIKISSSYVGVGEKTLVDCFCFFREVCTKYFEINPVTLGGVGCVVEVDTMCLPHKLKKHQGGKGFVPSTWVFGIVDTSTSPAIGYMEIVEDQNPTTTFPIIQKIVCQGSTVYAHEWKAYHDLQEVENKHQTIKHSINILEPSTDVHMQVVGSYWNKQHAKIKRMKGCKHDMLHSYLQEFMWRDRFYDNPFQSLCTQMSELFPL